MVESYSEKQLEDRDSLAVKVLGMILNKRSRASMEGRVVKRTLGLAKDTSGF